MCWVLIESPSRSVHKSHGTMVKDDALSEYFYFYSYSYYYYCHYCALCHDSSRGRPLTWATCGQCEIVYTERCSPRTWLNNLKWRSPVKLKVQRHFCQFAETCLASSCLPPVTGGTARIQKQSRVSYSLNSKYPPLYPPIL